MKEAGLVTKIEGNTAYLKFNRTSACARCGACGMIAGQNDITVSVDNTLHAALGERVEVHFTTKNALMSSAIAYIFPLIMLFVGVWLGYVCLLYTSPVVDTYHVRAVYIGGGTPTALDDPAFARLLRAVREHFPNPREFTVEAGRPDTITKEKLDMIKNAGAGRISINAQTTNDDTLLRIGRRHSAEEFFRAFELAKTYGFDSINTDIILGLPLETPEDTLRTLADVTRFEPENVTVHTLALKNASDFALENQDLLDSRMVTEMVEQSQHFLSEAGYLPYYLYRQKYMSGNMENVGFSKQGKESVYNIDIMEETVSVMAFGAGGISKKLYPQENLLKRAANVKDIPNYIERTCEMAERKKELF